MPTAQPSSAEVQSADLLNGDESNARILVDRYLHRLIPLVTKFIGPQLKSRVEPEDIVNSALRSVFRRAKEKTFEFKRSGDLWRLLADFAVKKAKKRVEWELAQKRHPNREVRPNSSWTEALADSEPHRKEVQQLMCDVRILAEQLDDEQRQILDMRLADYSVAEIARELDMTYARVNRTLRRIEDFLRRRMTDDSE